MYRNDSDLGAGFTLGILAGAAIGAGLALLFAPKAGQALRSDIADSVDSLRTAVAERYQELAERAQSWSDSISNELRANARMEPTRR